jgi:hypothetical protein
VKARLPATADAIHPADRRYFLQGLGQFIFSEWLGNAFPALFPPPATVEFQEFPERFHQALFEGVGLALWEYWFSSPMVRISPMELLWKRATDILSRENVLHIQEGWRQYSSVFDGAGSR